MLFRAQQTNQPLETKRLREMREAKEAEKLRAKYKKCLLRINFPNERLVLQATFDIDETIAAAIDFVRQYLIDPELGFYLFTAPPKEVLSPGDTFASKRLVPAALVQFGQLGTGPVLKPEVAEKVTTYRAITEATKKIRGLKDIASSLDSGHPNQVEASGSTPSSSHNSAPTRPASNAFRTSSTVHTSDRKVPKWFKPGK